MSENPNPLNAFTGLDATDIHPTMGVLSFLATAIGNSGDDGLILHQDQCLGLSTILLACEQALQVTARKL